MSERLNFNGDAIVFGVSGDGAELPKPGDTVEVEMQSMGRSASVLVVESKFIDDQSNDGDSAKVMAIRLSDPMDLSAVCKGDIV